MFGPLWLFPERLAQWAKRERLGSLHRELATATHREQQAQLMEEEAQILAQSTWPRGDTLFKITVGIIIAILLLPLGSALDFLPGEAVSAVRLPQVIREKCREFVADCYHLEAN